MYDARNLHVNGLKEKLKATNEHVETGFSHFCYAY